MPAAVSAFTRVFDALCAGMTTECFRTFAGALVAWSMRATNSVLVLRSGAWFEKPALILRA
jgi:hypothetical protein